MSTTDLWSGELTETVTTNKRTLNTKRVIDGKTYVWLQLVSTSTAAVDGSVVYETTTSGVVTRTGVAATLNNVRAVAIGAVAAGSFGWFQTWGDHSTVNTNGDSDIATGDAVIGASGDGVCNSTAAATAPTNKVIGWATAADVNTDQTVATYITLER